MKIAHVIFSLSPGGAEILVKNIVLNSSTEHRIEVWAVGTSPDMIFEDSYYNELTSHGISVVRFNKVPHKNRIRIVTELRKAIKQRKPDIIHTHSEIITIYAILASFGLNKTLIETIHNTVITYPFLHRFIIKHFLKKYVAISQNTFNLIRSVIRVPKEKIEIIFNGIDIRKFQVNTRIIRNQVNKIIAIGRLDEQKDHMTLLKAYALLRNKLEKEKIPAPVLMIVGVGILRSKLEQFINENQLTDNVILTGARSDIPVLLDNSDLWVMSSKWEGMSIALLEALASGIPIIATDVGSNNEVISHGQNGSLVPKEDPDILANEMFMLINEKCIRQKYSANALKSIEEFNILKCAAKYNSLYSSYYAVYKSISLQQY